MKSLSDTRTARDRASRLLQRLPGAGFAAERLQSIERGILQQLKRRMDRLEPSSPVSVLAVAMRSVASNGFNPPSSLQDLLARSSEQGRDEAQAAFFDQVIASLLPDHARILSALSDGSSYPLIHVLAASRIGLTAEPMVECVSNVGRNAGVQWPDATHVYLAQLRAHGVIETGPEDPDRRVQYEMLETEQVVRDSLSRLHKAGMKGHIVRRTVMLSALGRSMWEAGRISEDITGSFADLAG